MRHAARRDLNDSEITIAVWTAGYSVIDYTKAGIGIPDKLVTRPLYINDSEGFPVYFICWLEIKSEKGKLSASQLAAKAIWEPRGEWIEARDPAETVKRLNELYAAKLPQEFQR